MSLLMTTVVVTHTSATSILSLVAVLLGAFAAIWSVAWSVWHSAKQDAKAKQLVRETTNDFNDRLRARSLNELQRAFDINHRDVMLLLHRLHDTVRILAYHSDDAEMDNRKELAKSIVASIEADMDRLVGPRLVDPSLNNGEAQPQH